MFTFGIEHEVVFLDRSGQFSDYISASFDTFDKEQSIAHQVGAHTC